MSTALYDTLDALDAGIQEMGRLSPEYLAKMMHKVPDVPSVDRTKWLLARLKGKTILHVGCVGPLHEALLQVCARAYGIDQAIARYPDYLRMDLERAQMPLPVREDVEVVLLGEVLEHMTSPGALLGKVHDGYPSAEVIITVPNAATLAMSAHLKRGYENVNLDHTCWFSWRTLTTLVEKCGYVVQEWYWAGGKPLWAEGLIMVVRAA